MRAREELNLRPSDPQSDALSAELRAQRSSGIIPDFYEKRKVTLFREENFL